MGLWSSIKKVFSKPKTKTTPLPPVKQPSVVSIDVGTSQGTRGGGITITGGGGTGRRRGSSGSITNVSGGVTQQQAQQITGISQQDLTPLQKLEASKEDFSSQIYTLDLPPQDRQKKDFIYSPPSKAFISPSPTGFGSTGYIRQPTKKEKRKIEETQEKGSRESITEVGKSFFSFGASQLSKDLTDEDIRELYDPSSYVKTLGQLIDPRQHYKVFKSVKDFEKAVEVVNKEITKLENLNENFENKWGGLIDEKQNLFLGTEEQYNKYSKDSKKLDIQFNDLTTNPNYQKVLIESEGRKTVGQRISETNKSFKNKLLMRGIISGVELGSFINPIQRVLYGTDLLVSGKKSLLDEKDLTFGQKAKAGVEIGIGAVLLRSGLKGGRTILGKTGKRESVLGKVAQLEKDLGIKMYGREGGLARAGLEFAESKVGRIGTTTGIVGGIGAYEGVSEYKQTEDLAVSLGAGLGAVTGLGVPLVYERIRGGTRPTTLEKQELTDNLNKLENSLMKDFTIIRKGEGTKPNSDSVDIIATQKSGGFGRKIKISGDLIRGDKGFSFFPEGKGEATTFGTLKVKGQPEKGFTDVQIFDVQQFAKGFNIGEFRGYEMGTTQSITKYIPKLQTSRFFKVPKGRGIVIKSKEGIDKIKRFLEKKPIIKGGKGIIEIETELGRTVVAKKGQEPPETEPFQTKPKVEIFDITEPSRKLGKIIKDKPIEEKGYIFSEKRLGEFIKLGEPISVKEHKIKKRKGVKKTSLQDTFKTEPEIKLDLSFPKQKVIQIKKTKEISKALEKTDVGKVTKTIRKGLKERTQKVVEKLDTITTDIPKSVLGGASRSRLKYKTDLREISKVQQKERLDTATIEIPKELQKEDLALKQLEKIKQIQKLLKEPRPIVSIRPKIKPPKKPELIKRLIPFPFKRKRKIVKKPSKKKGYHVYVKPPKRKKFVKVTKKPVGLMKARDTRNYFIDETTSRQGYIKPTKQKINPLQFDIPSGYEKKTRKKFRTFKQKKGKRTRLPKERVIEKGRYLIDTKGEKQQLDIFKAMARAEKRKQRKSNKPIGLSFA